MKAVICSSLVDSVITPNFLVMFNVVEDNAHNYLVLIVLAMIFVKNFLS